MDPRLLLVLCVTLSCYYFASAQKERRVVKPPPTRFTCQGRASGYYADVETGCQVYHMCDGLGRQFSYSCPNTTLFQQRMLVCDHWYMVNCSKSESDYDANLLIGQRDKPFVSDEDMRSRTPRPDILSVPPNSNYYEGLREAETKFPIHPGNSIVGVADSIADVENNDLDGGKQSFPSPTSWSSGRRSPNVFSDKSAGTNVKHSQDSINEASQKIEPALVPNPDKNANRSMVTIPPPSRELSPPFSPTTEGSDVTGRERKEDPVFNFIKRFDPNLPEAHKTSMTKTQIVDINQQLPAGQVSSEEERTPRRNKDFGNNSNKLQGDSKGVVESNRFDSVNVKSGKATEPTASVDADRVPVPETRLLPPKTEYSQIPSTTMGPPIYYEWKWAVPAFDLEPPKPSNGTNSTAAPNKRKAQGRRPFSEDRSTTTPAPPEPLNTEYNISSYFVPDYVFPLDQPHPGYDGEDAETSFRVRVSRPGRASYGENEKCPHCHPAYVEPGTCEPCIVKR
ncbi:unnamed protein product, partial [Iphiclides podalirius]